jgi:hypothetical protein
MTRSFDPRPLLDFVLSYWRDHYRDLPRMVRYWEGLVRLMDDEWAQAEQTDDASNVWSCPTYTYHTYLHRKLENWTSYRVPHFHYTKFFRAVAGQTIFYMGSWISPDELSVFVDGKELDVVADPFYVTQDQDATQPGVNPTGSRMIFSNPRAAGQAISVYSSRELFRSMIEVPAGGLSEILSSRTIDPYSARVVLEKLNITRFLTLTATSFSSPGGFLAGEVFEVDDSGFSQLIVVSSNVASVTLPFPINPLTAIVYKKIGLDITKGNVWLEDKTLRATTPFPVASRVRVTDVYGPISVTPAIPSTVVDLGRVTDEASAEAFFLSGKILDAYSADDAGVYFARSFQEGTVILVEAAVAEPNDHAEYHEKTASPTQDLMLPGTRPLYLTPGLAEIPGYPIQVYVGGMLQPPDTYTFLSTVQIRLAGFVPAGTELDVHYVDLEDPRPHRHVDFRVQVAQPVQAYEMPDFVSEDWARYVSVDGAVLGDPDERWFSASGRFITFRQSVPQYSIIRVRGARPSYNFSHAIDPELVRAEFLQDGIDQRSATIPAGWTVQLPWETGFLITDGLLEANAPIENAWFVNAYVDEATGYRNFGQIIDYRRETSDEYMRILRAIFSGNYMGCQRSDIESIVCTIMGSQYLSFNEKVISVADGVVTAEKETLQLASEVPARVRANETYSMLWAVSAFAEIVDTPPEDFLPQAAEDFSSDYRFAHPLDTRKSAILDGGPGDYYTMEHRLEDLTADFLEANVWPGDLVKLTPAGYPSLYCRVTDVVDQHNLILDSNLVALPTAYGSDGYGWWAYGGGILIISNVQYRVWTRELDRLDEGEMLDRAREEDIPSLNERVSALLDPFVFKVWLRWAGLKAGSEQALSDVKNFLDRAKPAEGGYLVYASVNDDAGISEAVAGTLVDDVPVIEEWPDFAYAEEGIVGINGQVSPNAGSFVGS